MTGHAALARAKYEAGCNCAQADLCAYPELLPRETAMKLGASLGGGIGRLREVCGAVSAMVLLAAAGLGPNYPRQAQPGQPALHIRLTPKTKPEERT